MRTLVVTGRSYSIDNNCNWTGEGPTVDLLNELTNLAIAEIEPADGEPAALAFYHVIEQLGISEYKDAPDYPDPIVEVIH